MDFLSWDHVSKIFTRLLWQHESTEVTNAANVTNTTEADLPPAYDDLPPAYGSDSASCFYLSYHPVLEQLLLWTEEDRIRQLQCKPDPSWDTDRCWIWLACLVHNLFGHFPLAKAFIVVKHFQGSGLDLLTNEWGYGDNEKAMGLRPRRIIARYVLKMAQSFLGNKAEDLNRKNNKNPFLVLRGALLSLVKWMKRAAIYVGRSFLG